MSDYKWKPHTLLVSAEEVENNVGFKLEAGKYYKTRDGRKVQVHVNRPGEDNVSYPWYHDNGAGDISVFHGLKYSGKSCVDESGSDIVSEWQDPAESPIREVTKRELVAGVYGRFEVTGTYQNNRVTMNFAPSSVGTSVPIVGINSEELREAAHLFTQLAEYLEEEGE